MSNDEALLQKIYAHPEMRKLPVGYYSIVATVVSDILEDMDKQSHRMVKATMSLDDNESKEGGAV